jgi:hypothetical protein
MACFFWRHGHRSASCSAAVFRSASVLPELFRRREQRIADVAVLVIAEAARFIVGHEVLDERQRVAESPASGSLRARSRRTLRS